MLDASKAIDKVKYCKLFETLLAYNMSTLVFRFLSVLIQIKHCRSDKNLSLACFCPVSIGMKHGAILSPVLFAVDI